MRLPKLGAGGSSSSVALALVAGSMPRTLNPDDQRKQGGPAVAEGHVPTIMGRANADQHGTHPSLAW